MMRSSMLMRNITILVALAGLVLTGVSDFADAQAKKADKEPVATAKSKSNMPSDRAVLVFGTIALKMVPDQYKNKEGKIIKIDKSDPSKIAIPLDDAKRVIKAARISAHAQICDLADHQAANYLTMMRREKMEKKWTKEQMLFINRLHLFTVQYMTGNAEFVEEGAEKKEKPKPAKNTTELKKSNLTCTDEDRERVKKKIEAYVRKYQDKKS